MLNLNCLICDNKTKFFFKIKNFPINTINNNTKKNSVLLYNNLSLRFCNKCKNISSYPKIDNKILYNKFINKNFKFKNNKKFTINFYKKKKLKQKSKILEISKHIIFDKKILNIRKIKLLKINIFDLEKNLHKIKDKSVDLVYCYDFIGNLENIQLFLKIVRNKIKDNGKIYIHHNYGPSLLSNLSIDRVYFEHKNYLSITGILYLIKNLNMTIRKVKLLENKNFFEIEIGKINANSGPSNINKILKSEKKITISELNEFNKKNIINKKKLENFFLKNKNYDVFGFGSSIAAVSLIKNYKLDLKIKALFDDYPINNKFYIINRCIKIYTTNFIFKFNKNNKIIVILAPRYFEQIKKKISKYLNKNDFIINLVPKFIYYKKN